MGHHLLTAGPKEVDHQPVAIARARHVDDRAVRVGVGDHGIDQQGTELAALVVPAVAHPDEPIPGGRLGDDVVAGWEVIGIDPVGRFRLEDLLAVPLVGRAQH